MAAINAYKRVQIPQRLPVYMQPQQHYESPVTAYGDIISLPSTTVKGQVSDIVIKGQAATNLIENGNFADGETGWSATGGSISIDNNTLFLTATGTTITPRIHSSNIIPATHNRKIFARAIVKKNPSVLAIRLYLRDGASEIFYVGDLAEGYVSISGIVTILEPTKDKVQIAVLASYPDEETATDKVIEIQEIIAIDMTAEGLEDKTAEELNAMFPHYFDGTKSTVGAIRAKSVGKNLFNKNINFTKYNIPSQLEFTKVQIDGRPNVLKIKASNNYNLVDLGIKFKPNTSYVFKFDMRGTGDIESGWDAELHIVYTDGSDTYVRTRSSQWETKTIITPQDKSIDFIAFRCANNFKDDYTGYIDLDTFQIEEGDTATEYEPYKEDATYITAKNPETGEILELRSLPNGVKDEVNVTTGVKTQRVSHEWKLWEYDWLENVNGHTDDFWMVQLQTYPKTPNFIINSSNSFYMINYPNNRFIANSSHNPVNDFSVCFRADGRIFAKIPKSEIVGTIDNAKAKAWFEQNRVALIYQLANPVISYFPPKELPCYPSGTIYIEPKTWDVGLYNSGITIENEDIPIKSMDYLYKINTDNGALTPVSLDDVTIAGDGLSFTIDGATDGEFYEYGYEYDRSLSTLPTTQYSTPLGVTLPIPLSGEQDMFEPVVLGRVHRLTV